MMHLKTKAPVGSSVATLVAMAALTLNSPASHAHGGIDDGHPNEAPPEPQPTIYQAASVHRNERLRTVRLVDSTTVWPAGYESRNTRTVRHVIRMAVPSGGDVNTPVRVLLSRSGDPNTYATCRLDRVNVTSGPGGLLAVHKLITTQRQDGSVVSRKGECCAGDASSCPGAAVLPDLQRGDRVQIFVGEEVQNALDGTF